MAFEWMRCVFGNLITNRSGRCKKPRLRGAFCIWRRGRDELANASLVSGR